MNKHSYFLVAIISFVLFSCQKDNTEFMLNAKQGVEFTIVSYSKLKSSNCFEKKADYANITIDGIIKKVEVYYVNSKPCIKMVKLNEGEHVLNNFMLMDDNNTPKNYTDDVLLAATPHIDSEFAQYVANPLDITFEVQKFKTTQMPISVLCYEKANYSDFGFEYYEIE